MKLSAREPAALYPPVHGRQRRTSISVIPNSTSATCASEEIYFVKSVHRRSHSVAAGALKNNENMIDDDFRFLSGASPSLMDFASDIILAEQRRLALNSGCCQENAVSTVDAGTFKQLSGWAVVNQDIDFPDCSPRTPLSQLSNRILSWSPPALRKPSYVYFEVSPAIASDLLLPDCF